jgi:hypothetical protein
VPERCIQLVDRHTPQEVGVTLADHCRSAEDLLLVYYAGHGLLDELGELFLALHNTDRRPDLLKYTALPFAWIRDAMRNSPARTRVLILDCCFAGRAIGAMSDAATAIADGSEIAGTFTLTATSDNAVAIAAPGDRFTAFTGELIHLLRDGWLQHNDQGQAGNLTLGSAYRHLATVLPSRGLPRPHQRNTDSAADLILRPAAGPKPVRGSRSTPNISPASQALSAPIPDTFRSRRVPFHPRHFLLLAKDWRRLGPAVVAAIAVYLLWTLAPQHIAIACVTLLLFSLLGSAVYEWRRAATIETKIKIGFAASTGLVLVVAGVAAISGGLLFVVGCLATCFIAIALPGAWAWRPQLKVAVRIRSILFLAVLIAFLAGAVSALGLVLEPDGTLRNKYERWTSANTMALAVYFIAQAELVALCLIRTGLVLRNHMRLLLRPIVLRLNQQGFSIETTDSRTFVLWHHLERAFVSERDFIITFKRDLSERPPEFLKSAVLGGFKVADIRIFPGGRSKFVRSLAYYAANTYQLPPAE